MPAQINTLTEKARQLVRGAYNAFHPVYGFSTTSCQIYDTAWAAMIVKEENGERVWLFPESYHFLLNAQSEDGSWGAHPKSRTVGILDTAAATLALMRLAKAPLQLQELATFDIELRIKRGIQSLEMQLEAWDDLWDTNHIGVELIIPALLRYLESEDERLHFIFGSETALMQMHEAKMVRFDPEALYRTRPSSALHNLEALIGRIDFDRVEHHLFNGSMLASPSSTAAFLMSASSWNHEAEAYLRHVLAAGAGQGNGGFPGTFPTTYFELNWVLSTLLQAGFHSSDLQSDELHSIAHIVCEGFSSDHGVIGFAPRAVDVDDTAKGLLCLSLLGLSDRVSPAPMIQMFEGEDHFRTFLGERDPSFTSNCHVLLALMHRPDKLDYLPQIKKAIVFLCDRWWECDGLIKDKWHLSRLYPTMLLVQAFAEVAKQTADGATFESTFDPKILSKVSICLFQACLRTLLGQGDDGSWNGMPEESSYAVLTLVEARALALFQPIQLQIAAAISKARAFLYSGKWTSFDNYWTSKTAYRTAFVAEAYMLAASRVSLPLEKEPTASSGDSTGHHPQSKRSTDFLELMGRTELFSDMEPWELQASFLESALFVPLLRANRSKVFDRDRFAVSKDHYLDIIPFTWVGCNNRSRTYAATSLLFDLMMISMLGYQADEFIEAVAAPTFGQNTEKLHHIIDEILDDSISTLKLGTADQIMDQTPSGVRNQFGPSHVGAGGSGKDTVAPGTSSGRGTTEVTLQGFVHYVLEHPHVRGASLDDQRFLWAELRRFLHAHVVQIRDNGSPAGRQSGRTFFEWVRTTAADHVACAYSFAFACCLVSASIGRGTRVFPTVGETYLVQAAVRHMSTMCRMCNDIGSVERDLAEGNTNSIDFPEFAANNDSVSVKKQALSELAAYERCCLMHTIERLSQEALRSPKAPETPKDFRKRKVDIVRLFADVTDLYDQLYMLRDLSSTMK
ncbi:Ent-kaur-16-ene synthase [Byssothecium circinans]|uniref:Ent-kaur-16-ene synthase n=1 Tax=Byssothecium circinans TaxID=147558 RepID=A0A6A5UN06_9PLEO|nr:Ent-kaur-16-ene synthase [Byssothecium circinans]